MRLHHLSVTAFGPFVETVEVDFDQLSAGGLFLLTGDTGAGKTSVLDAVCFALYGEVPGDRHSAHHLHSDQADPSAAPEVMLRLSVGERTFRFTRSPAWSRPKKRGAGTVRVQAHVVVEEETSDGWRALTNRLDEAGHLVTSLLGMTCSQFTQVAMLPQNKFQEFLRAGSADRQAVLQRLFRTRRFEDVERWLAERRLTLHRRSQTCQEHTSIAVNRLLEAAGPGGSWPESWDSHDLDAVVEELEAWAGGVLSTLSADASSAEQRLLTADEHHLAARRVLEQSQEQARMRARGQQAQLTLHRLEATKDRQRMLTRRLDAHHRAAPVIPLVRRASTTADARQRAEESAADQVSTIAALLQLDADRVGISELTRAETRTAAALAVAQSWLPREHELRREETAAVRLEVELDELRHSADAMGRELEELATRRTTVATALDLAHSTARRLPADEAQLEAVEGALEAARAATALRSDLSDQRQRLAEATLHTQDLRSAYLDRRESRISGMAAELAEGLAVGCSCPVCGSAEHPSPAIAHARVTRADEDLARQAYETADFEGQAVKELVSVTATQLEAALVRSEGHRPTYWQRRLETTTTALRASRAAEEKAVALGVELLDLDDGVTRLTTARATAITGVAEREATLAGMSARIASTREELASLLEGSSVDSAERLVATHRRAAHALTSARAALEMLERCRREHDAALADVLAGVAEAGFANGREALVAYLTPAKLEAVSDELDGRKTGRATATSTLAEPGMTSALSGPEPDLPAIEQTALAADSERGAALAARELTAGRLARVRTLCRELTAALVLWGPVRQQHRSAAALAALVEGKAADNTWRMRLSAYVLGERLSQVVAAANERLAAMTDQRYLLEQSDERGAGEQRGGLSLRMRDQWSGKQRDPATLSGGETFLVSLALALGLADTVSHEAGGTELDTLFIDEGFGALDATTLDGVMDTLDALRDGGRVVGLVSHVPELRTRVTTQLEVRKSRRGSTVKTVVAPA